MYAEIAVAPLVAIVLGVCADEAARDFLVLGGNACAVTVLLHERLGCFSDPHCDLAARDCASFAMIRPRRGAD
jgi:hypothetical protein